MLDQCAPDEGARLSVLSVFRLELNGLCLRIADVALADTA